MQAHSVIKLWQALSPVSADALIASAGLHLQPSYRDDQFALLKLTKRQAYFAAEAVWARYFGHAIVIEMLFYQAAFTPFDVETVAYDAHREYRIPVLDLPRLSLAQVRPARVIGWLGGSAPTTPSPCLTEQTPTASLGLGSSTAVQAAMRPSL